MKSWIEKLFKRDPQLDYIISEYKPNYEATQKKHLSSTEYDASELDDADEMAIDNLYQRN